MQDKETLLIQLNRLTQDSVDLQAAIKNFQKEIEEAKSKIQVLNRDVDRHHGALNYNAMLSDSIRKQLEEIELASVKPQ